MASTLHIVSPSIRAKGIRAKDSGVQARAVSDVRLCYTYADCLGLDPDCTVHVLGDRACSALKAFDVHTLVSASAKEAASLVAKWGPML